MVKRKGSSIKSSSKSQSSSSTVRSKTLRCSNCNKEVENCGPNAVSVICIMCTQALTEPPKPHLLKGIVKPGEAKPRGWKFMNVYVSKDGDVYYKGVEQPELKGTLEPTKIVKSAPKKKLTTKQKEHNDQLKNELFAEIVKLKKQVKEGNLTSKYRRKAEKEIKLKEKKIKALGK
jgi:hypothetical protein